MSNFHERIAAAAMRFPDRVAIEWADGQGTDTTTYAALVDESARVAGWLRGHGGIRAGDRVAILASNNAQWVSAFMGALRCGAIVVPLDTAYSSEQVRAILADSGSRVLLAGARQLDTAREAAALAGTDGPLVALLSALAAVDQSLAQPPAAVPVAQATPDDAAVILYTSGTTADPKGVVLTHGNLEAERAAVLSVVQANEHDVVLGVLPLFHALAQMANLWLPLTIGAKVVFLETVSSTTLLGALETRGVTIFACVPQFFYLIHQRVTGEISRRGRVGRAAFRGIVSASVVLRDRFGWNPGRRVFARVHYALGPAMRLLITGGSRFDPAIARDLYGLGVSLYNGYGLTETSGAATIVRTGDRFNTSVGQPLPGVEIRIETNGGRGAAEDSANVQASVDADRHEDGEILIRGPIVMREYFRRPDATAEAIEDGWLRTGDLGRIDAEGRLYITGRKKEVIVLSSGKNLYPEEIEAHYRRSSYIKEICVLGLSRPDEPSAERLHAVVVPDEQQLRERAVVNIRELIRFELESLAVQLPAHKRILSYDISLEPLARTTTGKLRRGEIERFARTKEDASAAERPTTEAERLWLAASDHADMAGAIARHLDRAEVQPDANLELDLGLDSMERVELLTMLETHRGTRVSPDVRATIFTVRQLIEAVASAPAADRPRAERDTALPWGAVLAEEPDAELVRNLRKSKVARAVVIYALLQVALLLARMLLGLRVVDRSNIPSATPFIISPNHQTFLDGFFIAATLPFRAFRQIFFVGAAEFLETPVMAWGARAINIVPVDPDANLVNAMRAAAAGLRIGKVLMLFPEGERTIDGSIRPFRKGAAILASHLDVPIVPVGIDGLYSLWPRGRHFDWRALLAGRAGPVTLEFGAPFRIPPGAYVEGTARLEAEVAGLVANLRKVPSTKYEVRSTKN